MQTPPNNSIKQIIAYTPPQLYTGAVWYVGFMAFDPAAGTMRRKRIKLNFIERHTARRKYAADLIKRLNEQLAGGWSPWVSDENAKHYHLFADVLDRFQQTIEKHLAAGTYRPETAVEYISKLRAVRKFNQERRPPITYIYQFDRNFLRDFIDYVYIDKNNSAQTHNNYIRFCRSFGTWLVNNLYLSANPAAALPLIPKRQIHKQRTTINETDLQRLVGYLTAHNKHYLLACYLLYYCFIRPREMSGLRVRDFHLAAQTVTIPAEIAKNRKTGTITLPAKVARLLIELGTFNAPGDWFLFSEKFTPGANPKSEKTFRDYWARTICPRLGFPATYKFYSLKDSGITNMLRVVDTLSVRDQARHSSILITDIYTPRDLQAANELIKNHSGAF